ncbi:MAG: phosphotransferase [Pseudomonadota bacterium]
MTDREAEITAFLERFGRANATREQIAGDASNRRYERLRGPSTSLCILMDAPSDAQESVSSFVKIADHLRAIGLSAPKIYGACPDQGLLLIEDFGDDLFATLIEDDPSEQNSLYEVAIDVLIRLRSAPPLLLPEASTAWLAQAVAPAFKYYAARRPEPLCAKFHAIIAPLLSKIEAAPKILMLRDYHVENLLLLREREGVAQAGLLDFQDAMLAHPAYDLVSILQDARRDVPTKTERHMIRYYLDQTRDDTAAFETAYALFGLQRNMRILGVFARLSLRDHKPRYIDMIPRVWAYMQRNLAHPSLVGLRPFLEKTLPEPTQAHLEGLYPR